MNSREVYRLRAGSITRLQITKEPIVDPRPTEVVIEVKAIGLNFADVFAILGLYSATPKEAFIPGLECSGVIVATGATGRNYKIGDRVMAATRFGAYASHVTIDEAYVQPLPEAWSFEEGASYIVQVLTAQYGLIQLGAIDSFKTVLIHSAAGGVGIWANRIAKHFGSYTIGTVGRASKLDQLIAEGYDKGIVRNEKNFEKDLKNALDGKGLDLIMECIGGKIMKIGFDLLAPMGRQVIYGSAHYGSPTDRPNYLKLIPKYLMRPRIDPQKMIAVNKSVMAFNLIYLFEHKDLMRSMLDDLLNMNLGKPIIGHTFSFEELPDAIRLFQTGRTIGKVVVKINSN